MNPPAPGELLVAGLIALGVLLVALVLLLVASAIAVTLWVSLARSDSKYADINDVIIDPHAPVNKKERKTEG